MGLREPVLVLTGLVVAGSSAAGGGGPARALLCRLGDADPKARAAAAEALGGHGREPRVIESLALLARDPAAEVRASAADALARIGGPAVPLLIRRLDSMHEGTRDLAGRALVKLGKVAVQPLLARMKQDPDDSEEIAEVLGKVGAPAVPGLLRLLHSARGDLRESVAAALSENPGVSLKTLRELLKDKDPEVVGYAAYGLGHKGRAAVPLLTPLLHRSFNIAEAAAEALGGNGHPDAVAALTRAMLRGPPAVRDHVVRGFKQLKERGEPAVAPLWRALASKDEDLRRSAVAALGYIGKPAVRALVAALSRSDFVVREEAAEALEMLGPVAAPAVRRLGRMLADVGCHAAPSWSRAHGQVCSCTAAAEALGHIGPQALPPLVAGLRHREGVVREAAASGLMELGPVAGKDKAAREGVVRLLRDPLEVVRRRAAETLGCLGPAAAAAQTRAFATLPENLSLALLSPGWRIRERAPVFVLALKSRHLAVRAQAAVNLTDVGVRSPEVTRILVEALQGPGQLPWTAAGALEDVGSGAVGHVAAVIRLLGARQTVRRRAAARVLGYIGPGAGRAGAEPALIAALSDSDSKVVQHAAAALGKAARSTTALRRLRELLNHPYAEVRAAAAEGLGGMGRAATAARVDLIAALGDLEPEVQNSAALALARIGPSAAGIAALRRAMATMTEPEVAAEALGLVGPRAVRSLIAALSHREVNVRARAAESLGRIGALRAVGPLSGLLDDEDLVAGEAAEALTRIRAVRCARKR